MLAPLHGEALFQLERILICWIHAGELEREDAIEMADRGAAEASEVLRLA